MQSLFYEPVSAELARHGGFHNAHLHLDRAHTLEERFVDHGRVNILESSYLSLQSKHALIRSVHDRPAYDEDVFKARVRRAVDEMIACGTRLADTVVDVTPDRVGLTALTWMQEIARDVAGTLTMRAAAYTPLGFRDDEPHRWDLFEAGVAQADFIRSLAEADDRDDYPEHIGLEEHYRRILALARRTGKVAQIHTDQRNLPQEAMTERLIEVIRETGPLAAADGSPLIWAVHVISPNCYGDTRWEAFVEGLLECNIGVISCPSGALGMRAIRPIQTPTANSIARLLELAAAGVPVRIGSDNIADMCSPSTTANLMDEVLILSAALRFYQPSLLAKFAAGVPLEADDRAGLAEHLSKNDQEVQNVVWRWRG